MPQWGYSYKIKKQETDKVSASLREVRISPKHAQEICREIKGKNISFVSRYLADIIEFKRPVAFKRHLKKVGHRKGLGAPGRYPQKTAKQLINLLDNLVNNAEFRGLDVTRLKIIRAVTQRGRKLKRYTPRAYGRSSAKFDTYVHIELIAQEV